MAITARHMQQKKKIDKLDFIKMKNFGVSKHAVNRVKWQFTEWEKIFENHLSDKGLISRTYRKLLKFNNKNQTT